MKSYSFTIKFKHEIGYFSESKVVSYIRSVVLHDGFVLGKNVDKLKKLQVNGNEVKVSVSLLSDQNKEDLEKAVDNIKYGLKKKLGFELNNQNNKSVNSKKINTNKSKKKTSKNKVNKSTVKNKKKKSSFFNFF